jgi:hypothetical protein
MYRAGFLVTVSRELSRYMIDLVEEQWVRWEGSGTVPAGEYTFFYGKWNENHEFGTGLKNGAFWDVTPCGSCKNRCFGGT